MAPAGLQQLSRFQLFALVATVYYALRRLRGARAARSRQKILQGKADRKRRERDAKRRQVVADEGLDFKALKDGVAIVSLPAGQLLAAMEAGRYSAEEVMRAFCARSVQAAGEINPVTEELYEDAIAEAKKCDAERRAGRLRGPLHGLPISVKDQVHMEGFDSTCGLADRVYQPKEYTSVLITLLKEAGAIPFVRSNVPQCLMLPESMNNVWGASGNPYAPNRTPGGSSGGEGALVACGASPLGIGTDIGGSVRIPAAYCGVAGFKPTSQRISAHGVGVPRPDDRNGQNSVFGVAGPLARDVAGLELVMRAWCCEKMATVDPKVPCLPWDAAVAGSRRKLKFGVWRADRFFPPAPAVARAVEEAAEALRAAGHEVVEVGFDLSPNTPMFLGLMAADRMRGFLDALNGERLHPFYNYLYRLATLPNAVRDVIGTVKRWLGSTREEKLVLAGKLPTVYEWWERVKARDALKSEYIEYLQRHGIEAVIAPQPALPALQHGGSEYLALGCTYTLLWNNFHFPAGHVPTTYVREGEDVYPATYHDSIDRKAAADTRGTVGLPVGVQVVTLPWQDELCIKAMRDVESAVARSFAQPELHAHSTVFPLTQDFTAPTVRFGSVFRK